MSKLEGKVVVITGASSGVGRATAHAFAREGARLVLAARDEDALANVVHECERLGARAIAVPTDVTEEHAVLALGRTAADELGGIDVWVNNASCYLMGKLEETPSTVQRRLFETNVVGYINGIRAALPIFRAQGSGVLVQMASIAMKMPYAYAGTYAATKHAVRALSGALRQEVVGTGIRVVTVAAPTIDTPLFDHAANYTGRVIQAMPPIIQPERVAQAIVRAAKRPRREIVVGGNARLMSLAHRLMPGLMDRLFVRRVERKHLVDAPAAHTVGNLNAPLPPEQVSGGWSRRRRRLLPALAGGLALGAGALVLARR